MSAGSVVRCAVRPGAYYDSIVLMQLQRALAALPGVLDAGVVMATPANFELLAASGLSPDPETAAGPHDLLIAVKAESGTVAGEALARVDSLLQVRRSGGGEEFRPRSLASALKLTPEAGWVLISVPGRHAAKVAHEALDHNRNVFLYSDNVPLAEEVALKSKARERGLLVMGPDCGTAVIDGIGLGFANRVRRGSIGLIGASGTGLQAVMSQIHALGAGISQAIGTGGRDLSRDVGGITALQALDLLARDPETSVLVLISKPPAPEVALRLLSRARTIGKPVIVQFLGAPLPGRQLGNLHFAASLSEAAEMAVRLLPGSAGKDAGAPRGFLRGLFSGGTLAYEALLALSAVLSPISSNLSDGNESSGGHAILDLGADEFTVGRLHPMIDQDLRLRRLRQEAADPEVSLILLDVVLGEGAHADPAGELSPVISRVIEEAQAGGRELGVAVVVIGTDEDPQNLAEQIETLERAGAWVCRDVGELVDYAVRRMPPDAEEIEGQPVPLATVQGPVAAINVGLESFYDSLVAQGAPAVQVEWRPPAGGNEKLASILERMARISKP
jgi:FdrA protein